MLSIEMPVTMYDDVYVRTLSECLTCNAILIRRRHTVSMESQPKNAASKCGSGISSYPRTRVSFIEDPYMSECTL